MTKDHSACVPVFLVVWIGSAGTHTTALAAERNPNVVLIFADDNDGLGDKAAHDLSSSHQNHEDPVALGFHRYARIAGNPGRFSTPTKSITFD